MPFFTSTSIAIRLTAIVVSYAAPYIMLSLSYEPLFLFAFSTSMFSWLQAENDIACSNQKVTNMSILNNRFSTIFLHILDIEAFLFV